MDTFWNRRRKRRKKEIREKIHNERLIKNGLIRDIRTLFEQEGQDYYKPERVDNFWNNNCMEYESSGDKNRNLSLDEYLNKIKLYLRNKIIDIYNSDAWKTQLTIAINFIYSKDAEEEHVMQSTCNNLKFTLYSDVDEVVD